MGHYSELYEAEADRKARERKLETAKTIVNDVRDLRKRLGEVEDKLVKAGFQQLAWERLREIASDLRSAQTDKPDPQARAIAIAITHIETAILWLRQ